MNSSNGLIFRRAKPADLNQVFRLFQSAIADMDRRGIFQWDETYPSRNHLREDIDKGRLYIGFLDGKAVSAYAVNDECEKEYENGRWRYPDASFRVVHRLCVDPGFQGRGVGFQTMAHIEEELKNSGVETVRLDAFTENPQALRLYERLGYAVVGRADWRKGRFYLMEKKL